MVGSNPLSSIPLSDAAAIAQPAAAQGGDAMSMPHLGLLFASAVVFDAATMAAMQWPWPTILFSKPLMVAAGQTPPDNLPN